MKTCKECKKEHNKKNRGVFSEYCSEKCRKKQHYVDNKKEIKEKNIIIKDVIAERSKNYYINNKENILKKKCTYGIKNKEIILNKNKTWYSTCGKEYYKNRRNTDLIFKIKANLRTRLWSAIKNGHKTGSAVRDLGCSIDELKIYLEKQFQLDMTWDNWTTDGWHIDHIKPLASFDLTNEEELKRACHYSNLQPLWAIDNLCKSSKIS